MNKKLTILTPNSTILPLSCSWIIYIIICLYNNGGGGLKLKNKNHTNGINAGFVDALELWIGGKAMGASASQKELIVA